MPIFGGKEEQLSLALIIRIETVIEEFRIQKKLSNDEIKTLLGQTSLSRLTKSLGLNVKIEEAPHSSLPMKPPDGIVVLLGGKGKGEVISEGPIIII